MGARPCVLTYTLRVRGFTNGYFPTLTLLLARYVQPDEAAAMEAIGVGKFQLNP